MKKIYSIGLISLVAMFCLASRAGVFVIAGSGVNIPANVTTNFTNMTTPQVGTFYLSAQNVFLTQNGLTNGGTNLVYVSGLLSFDQTNWGKITQVYQFTTTNPIASPGSNFLVTNIAIPIYGTLSISNGQGQIITNFGAYLQF